MDNGLDIFVSPYGTTHYVQKGVEVKKSRSLRERFTKMADTSELEMNPEACTGLKGKLTYGKAD